jgi:hypothetical protein
MLDNSIIFTGPLDCLRKILVSVWQVTCSHLTGKPTSHHSTNNWGGDVINEQPMCNGSDTLLSSTLHNTGFCPPTFVYSLLIGGTKTTAVCESLSWTTNAQSVADKSGRLPANRVISLVDVDTFFLSNVRFWATWSYREPAPCWWRRIPAKSAQRFPGSSHFVIALFKHVECLLLRSFYCTIHLPHIIEENITNIFNSLIKTIMQ